MVVDGVIARPRPHKRACKLATTMPSRLLATRPELRAVVASKLSLELSKFQVGL